MRRQRSPPAGANRSGNNKRGDGQRNNDPPQTSPAPLAYCDPVTRKQLPPPVSINSRAPQYHHHDDSSSPFPSLTYTSRRDIPKSAIHWGQRKLFLSEMQLLTLFLADPLEPHWIIYVGSAPGQHLIFLDKLFGSVHEWELIDPGMFDRSLHELVKSNNKDTTQQQREAKFRLRSEYFDNNTAYELMHRRLNRAQCPALATVYKDYIEVSDKSGAANIATTNGGGKVTSNSNVGVSSGDGDDDDATTTNKSMNVVASSSSSSRATAGDDVNAARHNPEEIPIRNVESVTLPFGLGLLWRASASRVKTLFVSDVRSGNEDASTFEEHVYENSMAQETWTDILQPTFAMLKFRLPYSFVRLPDPEKPGRFIQVPGKYGESSMHLDGEIVLPIWARLTSTEARLVVREGAPRRPYNHVLYENQLFFFNSVLREVCHFAVSSPSVGAIARPETAEEIAARCELDRRFDGAAEEYVLSQYIRKVASRLHLVVSDSPSEKKKNYHGGGDLSLFIANNRLSAETSVSELSSAISRQLHGTINGAAKICDDKLLKKFSSIVASGEQQKKMRAIVDRAKEFRELPVWRSSVTPSSAAPASPLWDALIPLV